MKKGEDDGRWKVSIEVRISSNEDRLPESGVRGRVGVRCKGCLDFLESNRTGSGRLKIVCSMLCSIIGEIRC